MRLKPLFLLVSIIVSGVLTSSVFAADPLRLHLIEVHETQGSMTVTAQVVDSTGRQSTLTARDFDVFLNQQRLDIRGAEQLSADRQPAHVVLLVDVSGSMWGEPMEQAKASLQEFVAQLEMDDRIALVSFSDGVNVLQEFTSDRAVLDQAIASLEPFGDTALYDAVIAGVELAATAPPAGRLMVLLSDGVATSGFENRERSLLAPIESDVRVSVVGLGNELDVEYLQGLTEVGEGVYVQAHSPAELHQAYRAMTASVMRPFTADYALTVDVAPRINRAQEADLLVRTSVRNQPLEATMRLAPLDGAALPPFELQISGIPSEGALDSVATLRVSATDGRELSDVAFVLNGRPLPALPEDPMAVTVDPGLLGQGAYNLRVTAVDATGQEAALSAPFTVLTAPAVVTPGRGFPVVPVLSLMVLIMIVFVIYALVKARLDRAPVYVTAPLQTPATLRRGMKEKPVVHVAETEPAPLTEPQSVTSEIPAAPPLGRLLLMNEEALLAGQEDAILEFPVGTYPLLLGTETKADIRLSDPRGRIASEEARAWVQRGHLAYHKLTTLSAMATDGITSNWVFLGDGEELRVGPYRLLFQLDPVEPEEAPAPEAPGTSPARISFDQTRQAQDHGMVLQRNLPQDEDPLAQI